MPSLPRNIFLLVVWITFFFNIERLHINKSELINIAPPTYVLAAILLMVGLLLPQWRPISTVGMFAFAFFAFMVTKLLYGRPYWGEAFTYLTLFELTGVLITTAFAHRVGQLTADFVETLHSLFLSDLERRVYPPGQAEAIVKREMQSTRRQNHPLSILLVRADAGEANIKLSPIAHEIQRLVTQRLGLVALTRLLAGNLRPSDLIVEEINRGQWLLMTSVARRGQAYAILRRLDDQTKKQFGIPLRYGIASFPEQGLTFEDLIAQAEQDLKTGHAEPHGEAALDPTAISAEEPGVSTRRMNPAPIDDGR
jgi:hypothetical protein